MHIQHQIAFILSLDTIELSVPTGCCHAARLQLACANYNEQTNGYVCGQVTCTDQKREAGNC